MNMSAFRRGVVLMSHRTTLFILVASLKTGTAVFLLLSYSLHLNMTLIFDVQSKFTCVTEMYRN